MEYCNESEYIYEYKKTCYEECPKGTNHTGDYICLKNEKLDCIYDDSFIILCTILDIKSNKEIYNILSTEIIFEYSIDNEKGQIIEGFNNTIYQITSSKNELELLKNENFSWNNNHQNKIFNSKFLTLIIKQN